MSCVFLCAESVEKTPPALQVNMLLRYMSLVLGVLVMSCICDVDVQWMNDTLGSYFAQTRHHVTNPGYKSRAMLFIRDQFREAGLETHIHTFATHNENVAGENVIGVLKGRYFNTPQDKVVGIGAHYDTMRNTPGVDDNGAAVVTMLQTAREIARQPSRNYTVIFIAFDFEEREESSNPGAACIGNPSLCGSSSLVTEWIPNFWTQPVGWRGIFVMDTIMNFDSQQQSQEFPVGVDQIFPQQSQSVESDGKRGDFLMIAGRAGEDNDLVDAFSFSWNQQGEPQFEAEMFSLPPSMYDSDFSRSDHASFWKGGLNAVFITDTANFRGYMQSCYHAACDSIQEVTPTKISFVAKTCRTLISLVNNYSPVVGAAASAFGWSGPNDGVIGLVSILLAVQAMHQQFP